MGVKMDIYIGIDTGKYATKVAVYDKEQDHTCLFNFRTRVGSENIIFEDDAIEKNTFIVEYDGKMYKVGNGGKKEASYDTSKKDEIHKICALTAIARCVPANNEEAVNVHVAIGMPIKIFLNAALRNEFRDFILPDGEIIMRIKEENYSDPVTKKFQIVSKIVCPESGGALFLNPLKYKNAKTAVIDLGNLNCNGTVWSGFDPISNMSFTENLGGRILLMGLAGELAARYGDIFDVDDVIAVLRKPLEERKFTATEDEAATSAQFIHDYLCEFVENIKTTAMAKRWSVSHYDILFIGGTAKILENEIKEVFPNAKVVDKPNFANVIGFLAKIVSKDLGELIPEAKIEMGIAEMAQTKE